MSSKSTQPSTESAARSDEDRDDRARTGGVANWLLLEGNRLVIAGGVLAGILLGMLTLLWVFGFSAVRSASPMYFLFSSLVTGDLTLVTVVLSINQLVLSRELGTPGTLSQRIQGTLDYRSEVEESTGTPVSPQSPTRFLRFLHDEVRSQTRELEDAIARVSDDQLTDRLHDLASSLSADVETVNRSLEADEKGIFEVVAATIETNHATQLQEIAAIRDETADALSGEVDDLLDTLDTYLLQIDVARKYFETVFVQKELAYLSRVLLYVGVPAIVIDGFALLFYNAVGPVSVAPSVVYVVAAVAFTIGFAPLAILFAFVLRLAWVAQRTATVTPFSAEQEYRS